MQIKYIRKSQGAWLPILWLMSAATVVALSSDIARHIKNGLSLCIETVIPSVFPFMLISSLMITSGGGASIGRFFKAPLKLLFGADSNAACAIAIGLICGYPNGAIAGAQMLDRGEISKSELEYLLSFINLPSAAFVIGGVGGAMLSSEKMGIAIYASVVLSALITGIILRPHASFKKAETIHTHRPRQPFSFVITESISKAAKNMLTVCASVITFSALSGAICSLLPVQGAAKAIISGFFEVSSGARSASSTPYAPLLCASICAFSGLSVHFQIISVCRGRGISFLPFFISKAAQAVLAPVILSVYLGLCR